MSRSVFLLGPGFIGGEILDLLLISNYKVTTLVRRESAVADYTNLGVETVVGNLDDSSVIKEQVAVSDVVLHTATADHLPSVQAIIDGIRQRAAEGLRTIYIHNSGATLLSDTAQGEYKSDAIYDDELSGEINALPDSASHRQIDLVIVRASQELASHAKMAIMIPPLIYGVSTRENRLSIQLPTLIRYSIKHGYAGQIGKGLAVWSQIHVKDLARGYMVLLHWMERVPATEIALNPYFFCENDQELSWGECAAEIGRILKKAGRIDQSTPKPIPKEDWGDLFGDFSGMMLGSNARNRANRLRKLGWAPLEKGTLASLTEDEIPIIMKETGEFKGYASVVAS
ncbi:Phosphatidylethanolamine-binding protein PEBP [Penicillium verrucosum]|uniref:Phosphatidylethanolamine-binding protein PEBP n=1 Tax=Penicillium verrucosum TaxID=60171 RepID=UPI0025451C27|nr:Phosphatidylethanolamine-binding protein PEBP [Penicillium verrucosum]KAJ5926106.1 Phosphatidylethanolamine-binding protein PEBP [Penicillium verrucosum]